MTQKPVPATRQDKLAQLRTDTFEVVVIGGGITGAGIARDAAMRGLKTALLERRDFASGASSKSARQIHGGLRYIERLQLGLVAEACAERRKLLSLAPPWVTPLLFTLPMYRGQVRPLELQMGMGLYDALARFQNVRRHRMISRDELAIVEPAISQENLAGAARYYEAVGDDARLTLATILSAQRYGAVAVNYAQVEALLKAKGRVAGLKDTQK